MASGSKNVNCNVKEIVSQTEETCVETLNEVFTCFICMDKLKDARLCPSCSKLCCFSCIQKWITEQRPQCPHCRSPLHLIDLINCRWAEEVTQQIDSLQKAQTVSIQQSAENLSREIRNGCEMHREKLSVYCLTCSKPICHQCALFDGHHIKHSFKPLKEVYDSHVAQIQEKSNHLKRRHVELIAHVHKLEKSSNMLKKAKLNSVAELRRTISVLVEKWESILQSNCLTLKKQKDYVTEETESIKSLLHGANLRLKHYSKAELVSSSMDILKKFDEVQRKPIPSFVSPPMLSQFVCSHLMQCTTYPYYCNSRVHHLPVICHMIMKKYYGTDIDGEKGFVCPSCEVVEKTTYNTWYEAHKYHLGEFSKFYDKATIVQLGPQEEEQSTQDQIDVNNTDSETETDIETDFESDIESDLDSDMDSESHISSTSGSSTI